MTNRHNYRSNNEPFFFFLCYFFYIHSQYVRLVDRSQLELVIGRLHERAVGYRENRILPCGHAVGSVGRLCHLLLWSVRGDDFRRARVDLQRHYHGRVPKQLVRPIRGPDAARIGNGFAGCGCSQLHGGRGQTTLPE